MSKARANFANIKQNEMLNLSGRFFKTPFVCIRSEFNIIALLCFALKF